MNYTASGAANVVGTKLLHQNVEGKYREETLRHFHDDTLSYRDNRQHNDSSRGRKGRHDTREIININRHFTYPYI